MKLLAMCLAPLALFVLSGCGPETTSASSLPIPTAIHPLTTPIEVIPTFTPVSFLIGAWTATSNVPSYGVVPINVRFTQDLHGVPGATIQATAYFDNVATATGTSQPTDEAGSAVVDLPLTGHYSSQPVQVYVSTTWQGHTYSCFTFFSVGGAAYPTNSPPPYYIYRYNPTPIPPVGPGVTPPGRHKP